MGRWRTVVGPIDPLQRSVGCPGPQLAAIDPEVLRAQQRLDIQRGQQQLQKSGQELLVEQPIAILGERGGVPDEPARQQGSIQLLDQHPLGADAVGRLQQQDQQELLRRDRGSAALVVAPAEAGMESIQRRIGQPPHLLQGMGLGDPLHAGDVGEQGPGPLLLAGHPLNTVGPIFFAWMGFSPGSSAYSENAMSQLENSTKIAPMNILEQIQAEVQPPPLSTEANFRVGFMLCDTTEYDLQVEDVMTAGRLERVAGEAISESEVRRCSDFFRHDLYEPAAREL